MKWHWLPLTSVEGLRKLPLITPVHHQVLHAEFPGLTFLLSGELPPTPPPVPRPGVSGSPAPSAGGFPVHSVLPRVLSLGKEVLPAAVRLLIHLGSTPAQLSSHLLPRAWVSCSHCRRQGAATSGSERQYACAKPARLQHSAPQKQQDRGWREANGY